MGKSALKSVSRRACHIGRCMQNTDFDVAATERLISASVLSNQSNQSHHCPQDVAYPLCAQGRLVRMFGCRDRCESSLGDHVILFVLLRSHKPYMRSWFYKCATDMPLIVQSFTISVIYSTILVSMVQWY